MEINDADVTLDPPALAPPTPSRGMTGDSPIITDNDVTLDEHRYGTGEQQFKAGLEGFARGVAGPLAPMIEKAVGVRPAAIRGRRESNPWTSGTGEMVGLLAPLMMTGGVSAGAQAGIKTGELGTEAAAGLAESALKYGTPVGWMTQAGETALHAAGLEAPTTYAAKVGSAIVRQAAEAAVYQGSDEISNMVAQDKNAPLSVEGALANVGLGAAIGGAAGGLFAGAVSPLWKATIGPKVEQFLQASKYHLDDTTGKMIKDFSGVSPAAELKSIPDMRLRGVADEFAASKGLKINHDIAPLVADPERGAAIAKAYERAVNSPNDPKVRKAYDALSNETMEQWEHIKKTGLKVEPIPRGIENPYKTSADMMKDVRENNHMWYFPTSDGFGHSDTLPKAFSNISSQVGDTANPVAHDALKADLLKAGFKVSEGSGKYGGFTEPSFMVEHNGSRESKQILNDLGKKYGQESVLHSIGNPGTRLNELAYSDGRPSVRGFGVEQNPNASKDFTENPLYGKFNLKFDKEVPNTSHPLLAYTGEMIDGKPMQINDVLRIVHDYFGHAKEGFSFGSTGEENAWRHHMQMFSPEAQKALTTETRGQNSWVNFGPKGAENRANPAATQYPEEKAAILPAWTRSLKEKPVNTVVRAPINLASPATKSDLRNTVELAKDLTMEHEVDDLYQSLGDQESGLNKAFGLLGIDQIPVMKAAMSGEPKAIQIFNELRESQHPQILASLKELPEQIHNSVASSLGTSIQDAAHFSERDAGHELFDTFSKEYNEKYQPIAAAMDKRNAQAATIPIRDEARRDFGGQIIEKGMNEVGTDSPFYDIYSNYAQRVMAKNDMAGLDKIKTELFNSSKSMSRDINEKNAFRDIRNMISDFQDKQIESHGYMIGKEGLAPSSEIIAQRQAANESYKNFSRMSEELSDHLGTGQFKGAGTLKDKLEGLSPEDLLKKFSPRGNVDSIPFLQKYFPESLNKLQETEAKKFLAPSVFQEHGESSIDMNKLNRALEKTLKGSPEYAKFVLPPGAQEKIQAARQILDAIPGIKSSGTAGWINKMLKHMPASAMSMIGFMSGHNPVSSYLLGEVAQRLGRDVPDALKLSYLKYLGADRPVQAEGFHAMTEMLHNSMRGHQQLANSISNVFKTGSKVLVASQMPNQQDRTKLDKIITKVQENPAEIQKYAGGALGHYMPTQQTALTKTMSNQLQYLQSLKPQERNTGPFDQPHPPSDVAIARYNQALDIANNPSVVLEHVKDGTLQATDVQDLKMLYPSLYETMSQQLINQVTNHKADEEPIPYKTRMGVSLFLGQPLDSTMTQQNIMAAQLSLKTKTPQQGQQQGQQKRGTSTLGKSNKSYQTHTQSAEQDRSGRE